MKRNRIRPRSQRTIASACVLAILASLTAFTTAARAEDAVTDPWKVDVYYENDTHFRGKDKTGETVGLSKFRNTLQVEADKRFGGWNFHGIFRGSFDGVYRMNADPGNLEWVMRMRLVIPGVPPSEALQLARAIASQGRLREAAAELEARADQDSGLAETFLPAARSLRAQLN